MAENAIDPMHAECVPRSIFELACQERDVAQQEIERLEEQLTTEASLTASWIEQCERYKVRAETAEAERDEAIKERDLSDRLLQLSKRINRDAIDQAEQLRAERDKLREALDEAGGVLAALLLADQTAEQEDGLRVHAPEVLDAIKQAEAGARAALASTEER